MIRLTLTAFTIALALTTSSALAQHSPNAPIPQPTLHSVSLSQTEAAISQSRATVVTAYELFPQQDFYQYLKSQRKPSLVLDGSNANNFTHNTAILADYRSAGGHGGLTKRPSHIKAVTTENAVYLTDRNWAKRSLIIVDYDMHDVIATVDAITDSISSHEPSNRSTPTLALNKHTALDREAALINRSPGPIRISTESFGFPNPVASALLAHASNLQLIVAQREYDSTPSERAFIDHLRAAHADVRTSDENEKLALTNAGVFVGSANASPGVENQIEWGIVSSDPSIVDAVARRWNALWRYAKPIFN